MLSDTVTAPLSRNTVTLELLAADDAGAVFMSPETDHQVSLPYATYVDMGRPERVTVTVAPR